MTHWRLTEHPRFADLAEWATARALADEGRRPLVGAGKTDADAEEWRALLATNDPLDLPRLIDAVRAARPPEAVRRVELLAKLNDPRVTAGLLALLRAPPSTARTAVVVLRACASALEGSGDPRVRRSLEELSKTYRGVVDSSSGDDVAALLLRTAASLRTDEPAPLSAKLEARCTALEAHFEAERAEKQREERRRRAADRDDEGLLAAIYAAPQDDGPRHVFADALTERGDPRGEFIALQLNRAKGDATPEQLARERELCSNVITRMAWGLPLSRGADCHLSRGLPDTLKVEPRTFKSILRDPALAIVHSVTGLEGVPSLRQTIAFLAHRHFTSVGMLKREQLEALPAPLPWRSVSLDFVPGRAHRSHLANTRELELSRHRYKGVTAATFEDLPHLISLKVEPAEPSSFGALRNLEELHAYSVGDLRSLEKLRRLTVYPPPTPSDVEGLGIESLSYFDSDAIAPDDLIEALPKLTEVRVRTTQRHRADVFSKLMASKRLARLPLVQFVFANVYEFRNPFTAAGVLDVRISGMQDFYGADVRYVLENVSPDCVSKIRLRPSTSDPWEPLHYVLSASEVEELRRIAKVPVELAWY